jgi:hypothetical protein
MYVLPDMYPIFVIWSEAQPVGMLSKVSVTIVGELSSVASTFGAEKLTPSALDADCGQPSLLLKENGTWATAPGSEAQEASSE